MLSRTTRAGDTIAFAYDTLNRLVSKAVAGGTTVSYGYDLAGRTTSVGDDSPALAPAVPPGGSTVAYTTSYAYDALDRPTGITFSDHAWRLTRTGIGSRSRESGTDDDGSRHTTRYRSDNARSAGDSGCVRYRIS